MSRSLVTNVTSHVGQAWLFLTPRVGLCTIAADSRQEDFAVYAPPPWLIALGALLTGLAVAGVLYAWTGSRDRRRIVVATVASMIAFLTWRGALIIANGANLDIDYPLLLGLSFEDIGSGVMAFLFTALALGLGPDAAEPARRVVTTAGLAGAAAIIVDRFV